MDPNTAAGAYGFGAYSPATPGGLAIAPPVTQLGGDHPMETPPGIVLPDMFGGHIDHPLFWFLILVLVFTGYVFGSFDVGIKRVVRAGVKVG